MTKSDQINFDLACEASTGGCIKWHGRLRDGSSFALFCTQEHGIKPAAWYALGCPDGVGLLQPFCKDENCVAAEHQRILCVLETKT